MKVRLTALILLLAVALTACAQIFPQQNTEPATEATQPTVTEAPIVTDAPETTEAPTEAPTEATEAPTEAEAGVDLGVVDGNDYKNETLGIRAAFPDGWYLFNETDIAALNKQVESTFDDAAVNNAIGNGQTVIVFCASHPTTISSVNVTISKNQTLGMSEEAMINLSLSAVKAQLEQAGVMQNVTCEAAEAEFCGQKHTVLAVSGETSGMQLYETIVYLTRGDLLYNVTVSATQETAAAEILDLFKALG